MTEYFTPGYIVGWLGVLFGLAVPIPQLIKIKRTGKTADIAVGTYSFLFCCLICYLIHAVYIGAIVFVCAQIINLCTNGSILVILIRKRRTNGL